MLNENYSCVVALAVRVNDVYVAIGGHYFEYGVDLAFSKEEMGGKQDGSG